MQWHGNGDGQTASITGKCSPENVEISRKIYPSVDGKHPCRWKSLALPHRCIFRQSRTPRLANVSCVRNVILVIVVFVGVR